MERKPDSSLIATQHMFMNKVGVLDRSFNFDQINMCCIDHLLFHFEVIVVSSTVEKGSSLRDTDTTSGVKWCHDRWNYARNIVKVELRLEMVFEEVDSFLTSFKMGSWC